MREITKRIELSGREFIIKKLPAMAAYSLLVEFLTKGMPMNIIGSALEQFVPANMLSSAGKQVMTEADMERIQRKLISCVSEVLPAGPTPVIDSQGYFQVEDMEYNMFLFGQLLVKVVDFQYHDFFIEALDKLGVRVEDSENLRAKATGFLLNGADK